MTDTRNPLEIDLTQAETIAFVSSRTGDQQTHWTELAVRYLPNADGRAFFAEVLGQTAVAGQTQRRRAIYVGSIARALEFFDQGDLFDSVQIQVADWADRNAGRLERDLKQLREVERRKHGAPIGFTGEGGLAGALRWLYGDISEGGASMRLELDFGVPNRTVRHALRQQAEGKPLTGWAKGFLSALLFFDRAQFQAAAPAVGADDNLVREARS